MSVTRNGKQLKDVNNNKVILRGICGGASWQIYYKDSSGNSYTEDWTQANISSLASDDCGVYRFFQNWGLLETSEPINNGIPTVSNIDSTYLNWIDTLSAWCKQYKIFFVFCFADLNGGDGLGVIVNWGNNSTTSGQGDTYPTWLTGSADAANTFDKGFFTKSNSRYNDARQAFNNLLQFLATRYASNPYFLFEVMNEPLWSVGTNQNSWDSAYISVMNDAIAGLRSGGYANVCIIDVPIPNYDSGITYPTVTTDSNIMYDAHVYRAKDGTTDITNWINYANSFVTPYMTNLGFPIYFGEWSNLDSSTQLESCAVSGVTNPDSDSVFLSIISQMITWINNNNISASTWFTSSYLYGWISGWKGLDQATSTSVLKTVFAGQIAPYVVVTTPISPTSLALPLAVGSGIGGISYLVIRKPLPSLLIGGLSFGISYLALNTTTQKAFLFNNPLLYPLRSR